ncbi:hypothetical protein BIW11_13448 [Tropilaelaps mercedesae]|uniref:Uncharacterized protein n=1 Tax=Tropilaelaps mercedesae TaxID=418985 RepID=A0A1V9X1W0_9ACAR|nr:hypothetical protein BIW11_13448 [Tropilaelaps mercedesae]
MMYAVTKAQNGVLSKTRLHGFNGIKYNSNSVTIVEPLNSISPPSGSRSPEDAVRRSSSVESITSTGPRPVFLGCANSTIAGRGSRQGKKALQQKKQQQQPEQNSPPVRPDSEVISFFARSWLAVNQALESSPKAGVPNPPLRPHVVHYRPAEPAKLPDFVPCNYETVWAEHQYHKMMRHIDLAIQTRNQDVREGISC